MRRSVPTSGMRARSSTRCEPMLPPDPTTATRALPFRPAFREGLRRRLRTIGGSVDSDFMGTPAKTRVEFRRLVAEETALCVDPAGEGFGLVMPRAAGRATDGRRSRLDRLLAAGADGRGRGEWHHRCEFLGGEV